MFLKDPAARVDYRVDWTEALGADVTIAASEWMVVPAEAGGVAVVSDALAGNLAIARLDGGVAGHLYRVTNHVGFSDGGRDERSLMVRVEER